MYIYIYIYIHIMKNKPGSHPQAAANAEAGDLVEPLGPFGGAVGERGPGACNPL